MYEDIFKNLSYGKTTMDSRSIKDSLLFFIDRIKKACHNQMDKKTFTDFICDRHLLFQTKTESTHEETVDITISTE